MAACLKPHHCRPVISFCAIEKVATYKIPDPSDEESHSIVTQRRLTAWFGQTAFRLVTRAASLHLNTLYRRLRFCY